MIVRKERCSDVIVSEFLGTEKQSGQARREHIQIRVRPRERGDLMGCHSRAGPLPQRVSLSRMSVRTTQIATLNVIINIKPLEKMTNDQ